MATRSTINLKALKLHLKIDEDFTASDVELKRFLAAAKEDADRLLINPFTTNNQAGGTEVDIPQLVETWVLMRAAQLYEWRILQQRNANVTGIGSASIDPEPDYSNILHLRDPAGKIGF